MHATSQRPRGTWERSVPRVVQSWRQAASSTEDVAKRNAGSSWARAPVVNIVAMAQVVILLIFHPFSGASESSMRRHRSPECASRVRSRTTLPKRSR